MYNVLESQYSYSRYNLDSQNVWCGGKLETIPSGRNVATIDGHGYNMPRKIAAVIDLTSKGKSKSELQLLLISQIQEYFFTYQRFRREKFLWSR